MANKPVPKQKVSYDSNVVWSTVNFSVEDEVALENWKMSDGDMLAGIMELQILGHSFGAKRAKDGVGYTAFAIGIDASCSNAGLGLSGYGPDPRDATLALLYKHFIIAQGEWPRSGGGQIRRFR